MTMRPRATVLRPGVEREPMIYWHNVPRFVGFLALVFFLRIIFSDVWAPFVGHLLGR